MTDAQRLLHSHISNARPNNGDADDPRAEEYAGLLIAESVPSSEDRIEAAYWRLREQMEQGVPGGEELWSIARVGYDLAAQDKKNGNVEKASVYSAMATLAAVKFEVARKMAVQS